MQTLTFQGQNWSELTELQSILGTHQYCNSLQSQSSNVNVDYPSRSENESHMHYNEQEQIQWFMLLSLIKAMTLTEMQVQRKHLQNVQKNGP